MRVRDVQQRLQTTRQTVHDMAERGELHFVTRKRGKQDWKYFDPAEVEERAQERGVPIPPAE